MPLFGKQGMLEYRESGMLEKRKWRRKSSGVFPCFAFQLSIISENLQPANHALQSEGTNLDLSV
jgi:hypothetical protein